MLTKEEIREEFEKEFKEEFGEKPEMSNLRAYEEWLHEKVGFRIAYKKCSPWAYKKGYDKAVEDYPAFSEGMADKVTELQDENHKLKLKIEELEKKINETNNV